ncbi:MAG: N-6 DNA methylase [Solirubrobacterales bacterium]
MKETSIAEHSYPAAASAAAVEALVASATDRRTSSGADGREAFRSLLGALPANASGPAWEDGRDVVGEAYERVVSASTRRRAGQFFTPLWVARAMAHWLLGEPTTTLLDPGCGSGSLLIAAAIERTHPGVRLLGVDSDWLAIEMAETTRAIRRIESMEVRRANFLLDELAERPDAVICNPPFTRHHDIDAAAKRQIHEGFEERLGLRLSRLSSLHVLFLVRALEVSAEDARLAFITPSHWLEMAYGREVKRFLLEHARVEAIVNFPAEQLVFPGVRTTATITLIRKGRSPGPTRILECDGLASAASFIASDLKPKSDERDVLLTAGSGWGRSRRSSSPPAGTRLRALAVVHRGVATGHNSFFVLSERRRRELAIGVESCRPCLASPRHLKQNEVGLEEMDELDDEVPRWLLAPRRLRATGPLRRYLDLGEIELGVTKRTLVQSRLRAGRRWFEVAVPERAPILFSYFNRPRARFVRNYAEAVPLNSWLVVRPREGVDADELFRILSSPEVATRLADGATVYGKGLWKLEPSQLQDAWLPPDSTDLLGSAN